MKLRWGIKRTAIFFQKDFWEKDILSQLNYISLVGYCQIMLYFNGTVNEQLLAI